MKCSTYTSRCSRNTNSSYTPWCKLLHYGVRHAVTAVTLFGCNSNTTAGCIVLPCSAVIRGRWTHFDSSTPIAPRKLRKPTSILLLSSPFCDNLRSSRETSSFNVLLVECSLLRLADKFEEPKVFESANKEIEKCVRNKFSGNRGPYAMRQLNLGWQSTHFEVGMKS